ncbi:hypothetical protein [Piscinibacter defluvii]|uniref:hypothetical protein n=1 Tax=Piscinibacter defluvii TaxID=1796922 RepID=UPI000FDCECCC|nr:hypothetical protein [Piscinibacter defluvii]
MRPLNIDVLDRGRVRAGFGIALALSLLLLAGSQILGALEAGDQATALALRLQERSLAFERQQGTGRAASTLHAQPAYYRDAVTMLQAASFDAATVLSALESVHVAGVRVLAVEIVSAERLARVDLEVMEPAALTDYLDGLNAGLDTSQRWELLRVQSPSAQAAGTASIVAGIEFGRR